MLNARGGILPEDFSLVLGGPLYQLFQRTRIAGDTWTLLRRRIVVLALLAWAPLLVLSILEGHAWGDAVKLTFLKDVEIHARFLLALPLLILAELVVHHRMRPVLEQFVDRDLIPEAARSTFDGAIASALRLRNSLTAELVLIGFVYIVGVVFLWRTQIALDVASWYGIGVNGRLQPSLAGWWLGFVSLPLFQFLLLRWYFRLFIWARFLWQVSRIELRLIPTHPDRCGGLGFLSGVIVAFAPVLVAQGAVLAGMIANRIFYAGARLPDFEVELVGLVAVLVFAILGPLMVFAPRLSSVKRTGLREYGTLSQRHAREFDHKWLRGGAAEDDLVGSPDISSMADLVAGFEVVKDMRLAPFTIRTVLQLAVVTLVPVAPLLLTMIPLKDLLERLLQVAF
jgi:hypothetical protein